MLLDLTVEHCESAKWSASLETRATKEEVVKEVLKKVFLKARPFQSLSDAFITRKRKARDVLLQHVGYQRLLYQYSVASDEDVGKKREGIDKAQEILLRKF